MELRTVAKCKELQKLNRWDKKEKCDKEKLYHIFHIALNYVIILPLYKEKFKSKERSKKCENYVNTFIKVLKSLQSNNLIFTPTILNILTHRLLKQD